MDNNFKKPLTPEANSPDNNTHGNIINLDSVRRQKMASKHTMPKLGQNVSELILKLPDDAPFTESNLLEWQAMQDSYSNISEPNHSTTFAKKHRWHYENKGERFTICCKSTDQNKMTFVSLSLVYVSNKQTAAFLVDEAFDVEIFDGVAIKTAQYGPFEPSESFLIHADNLLVDAHSDTIMCLLRDLKADQRIELFKIVQAWALQPLKG